MVSPSEFLGHSGCLSERSCESLESSKSLKVTDLLFQEVKKY